MAEGGRSKVARTRDWTSAHPFTSIIAAGLVGLMIGGSGEGDSSTKLASATSAPSASSATRDAELSALEAERDDLEAEISELEDENSELQSEFLKLNARRPLPALVGSSLEKAEELEDRFGWHVTVKYRYSDVRPGTVLAQTPASGTEMRYEGPVSVVVARQIPRAPDVVGLTKARAARTLRADYAVVFIEQVSSRRPGTVIAMSPGGRVVPGETITLTVAKKAPPPPPVASAPDTSGCTAGYSPCLPPASDYDCAGGSGDGPKYTGYVTVTGSDPYDLDSDGDGAGCES